MRLGYALGKSRRADGSMYMYVPNKPRRAREPDFTRFIAWVVNNDPSRQVITVHASFMSSDWRPINAQTGLQAEIPWIALKRVMKYSDFHYHGDPPTDPSRPTKNDAFGYTQKKPYRTLTQVRLR